MLLVGDTPGTKFGRPLPPKGPKYKLPAPPIKSIGKPDIAVTMPAICHRENRVRPIFELRTSVGFGNSQIKLKTKRCVPTGDWWILRSSDNSYYALNWGLSADKLVPADYDGDGKTDIAVYRNGTWYVPQSSDGMVTIRQFGLSTDIPVAE